MNWTLRQVAQVSGLRADARVDAELVARARVDVLRATRERLARSLIEAGRPFAVEIHPGDVQYEESPDDWRGILVRAHWEPQTYEVEFMGGHMDGRILEVRDPGRPIVTAESGMWNWRRSDGDEALFRHHVVYHYVGWREDARRWLYAPTPKERAHG